MRFDCGLSDKVLTTVSFLVNDLGLWGLRPNLGGFVYIREHEVVLAIRQVGRT